MSSQKNFLYQLVSKVFVGHALICIVLITSGFNSASCYPAEGLNVFSSSEAKFEDKLPSRDVSAEQSFQQFIHSKPEPTIIGEIKPNSSEIDLMLLKNKIASTILSMQEMDKASRHQSSELSGADCVIEVTRVERVAGKCQKVNNGLPTCQSENYISINPDCN